MMRGVTLLALARAAVAETLDGPQVQVPSEPWLAEPGACFVTLRKGGELRGCIGSIEAHRSLGEDLVQNARNAAHNDPRFSPLQRNELDLVRFEVSLLTPLERLEVHSREEALEKLRPGVDGLLLQWGTHRGVFIPKMWQQLPKPEEFLGFLLRKAGLPSKEWRSGTRLWRFSAQDWAEPELRN
ncbi:AmmeMemoRadiSam system protein A [Hyalangium versicolor]|uniref:AmmeMemoRadiSam system protein A n=1 Tax=Hyalangium versicolor TaxID=2861190 RepID=UPI001CC9580C|nr:AmmeMemoRadiSam system protein A [Hyalangium versicolor]